jgi:hypothetical protein
MEAAMDQKSDREDLNNKLEQCRRLSREASDPTTKARLAKLIEELEHGLRQTD